MGGVLDAAGSHDAGGSPDAGHLSDREQAPVGAPKEPGDGGTRWAAVLLATAAMTAALLAMRSAFLGNDANDAWQRALRVEIKRGALVSLAVGYVYGAEANQAFGLTIREVLADEFRRRSAGHDPAVADVLLREARVHEGVVAQAKPAVEATSERYALPEGGYDLALRLVDERATAPDAIELDPDPIQAQGDRASRHAVLAMTATVPVGLAFLAGSLAMPWRSRRRVLIAVAWLAVLSGAGMGIALELLP